MASEKWGETPLAIIFKAAGSELDEAEIEAYCRENMAAYKVPKLYKFTEMLPRNASGKLLKNKLREQFAT